MKASGNSNPNNNNSNVNAAYELSKIAAWLIWAGLVYGMRELFDFAIQHWEEACALPLAIMSLVILAADFILFGCFLIYQYRKYNEWEMERLREANEFWSKQHPYFRENNPL